MIAFYPDPIHVTNQLKKSISIVFATREAKAAYPSSFSKLNSKMAFLERPFALAALNMNFACLKNLNAEKALCVITKLRYSTKAKMISFEEWCILL